MINKNLYELNQCKIKIHFATKNKTMVFILIQQSSRIVYNKNY
jgi:hypothetical protein